MSQNRNQVQEELDRIKRAHRGLLRPRDVVQFARDPKTALHTRFTWDDTRAAEQWRLQQARQVIRVYMIRLPEAPSQPVRAYASLKTDRTRAGGGYRPIAAVLSDEERRAQLLADALDELDTVRRKYQALTALMPIFQALDQVRTKVEVEQAERKRHKQGRSVKSADAA